MPTVGRERTEESTRKSEMGEEWIVKAEMTVFTFLSLKLSYNSLLSIWNVKLFSKKRVVHGFDVSKPSNKKYISEFQQDYLGNSSHLCTSDPFSKVLKFKQVVNGIDVRNVIKKSLGSN